MIVIVHYNDGNYAQFDNVKSVQSYDEKNYIFHLEDGNMHVQSKTNVARLEQADS